MKTTIVLVVLALFALLLAVCVSITLPFTMHPSQTEVPAQVPPRTWRTPPVWGVPLVSDADTPDSIAQAG